MAILKRTLPVIGASFVLGAWLGAAYARVAPPVLTIGIVPQASPWMTAERWTPIVQAWSRAAGVRLALRTAPTIRRFERRVARGEYDLVYLNPADYLRYRSHYRAFARGKGDLQGILVVRRGGPLRRLADLAHAVIAFPARYALAASIEPRHALRALGIPFRARYVGSHDAVYRGVAAGLFVAGGGVRQTYGALAASVRKRLAIVWVGPKSLPHPFAARRTLPAALVRRLAAALQSLPRLVPRALKRLGFAGFRTTRDRDYIRAGAPAR